MLYEFPIFAYIYALAAVLSLFSAAAVIWRRASPGSLPFALTLVSLAVWSIASIFESGALSVSGKVFGSIWQYVGIISLSPFWLYFCAEYTGYRKVFFSPLKFLVWIIPLITLGLVITNDSHGLIWEQVYFPEDTINNVAVYDHGTFFYIFTAYTYFLILIGTFWLIKKFSAFPKNKRSQVIILIISVAIGWASNILYIMGLTPIIGLDLTPISFVFIAMALTWFIYRKQLFDLLPIARSILVDNMSDGVVVLDDDGTVVDLNQAAIDVTRYQGPNPIGMTIWDMYHDWLPIIGKLRDQTDLQVELELPTDPSRYLDVKIDSIGDSREASQGQVITIRDVTTRKLIEIDEKEQRQFSEALANIAAVMNSSLNLDEVFEKILDNVGKVVPHDTSNIALIDEKGILRFKKVKGYEKYGTRELVLGIECLVKDIPNMQKMAVSGTPAINPNTDADPDWRRDMPGASWIKSYIGAPIVSRGKLLGFLNLDAATPNFFKNEHLHRLHAFANQAAVAIQNAQLYEEMEQLAITDSLTGLYNRRFFYAFAENEIERSKRYHKDLSMIMMDIDHFKNVNDRFGHQVGDQVLENVAKICLSILRKVDVMCRFGGEEFLVLLPETERKEAENAADRMCRAISDSKVISEGSEVKITVSIGVAQLDKDHDSLDKLILLTDKALYAAKDAGRNCVRVFTN